MKKMPKAKKKRRPAEFSFSILGVWGGGGIKPREVDSD